MRGFEKTVFMTINNELTVKKLSILNEFLELYALDTKLHDIFFLIKTTYKHKKIHKTNIKII